MKRNIKKKAVLLINQKQLPSIDEKKDIVVPKNDKWTKKQLFTVACNSANNCI
jgi:hypothetical protein